MKLDAATLCWWRLRGEVRAENARTRWREREALILELRSDDATGRGECAPLPGYSNVSLEACEAILQARPLRALDQGLHEGSLPAPLAFALDAAKRELRGETATQGEARVLATLRQSHDTANAVRKMKIGRDLDDELRAARAFDGVQRFDANGTLGPNARVVLEELAKLRTEFVEEPVRYDDLESLAPSPVPIALDESLQEDGPERLARALEKGWAHVAVLKPAALGPAQTRELARIAHTHGAAVVISHLFGGPLAYAATCFWAFEVGSPDVAHGLGRHAALEAFEGWSTKLGKNGILAPWSSRRWPVQVPKRRADCSTS